MTELNLRCHYQTVKSITEFGEEYTLHEAFSTDKGDLYMICPVPVYIAGESLEELLEIASHSKKDIDAYGVRDMNDITHQFEKYAEYTAISYEATPDYSTENVEDEEVIEEDDYHDADDKVLDLVEYIAKNKRK